MFLGLLQIPEDVEDDAFVDDPTEELLAPNGDTAEGDQNSVVSTPASTSSNTDEENDIRSKTQSGKKTKPQVTPFENKKTRRSETTESIENKIIYAYEIMKTSGNKVRDEDSCFGKYVGKCLRRIDDRKVKSLARNKINNILFEAECGILSQSQSPLYPSTNLAPFNPMTGNQIQPPPSSVITPSTYYHQNQFHSPMQYESPMFLYPSPSIFTPENQNYTLQDVSLTTSRPQSNSHCMSPPDGLIVID